MGGPGALRAALLPDPSRRPGADARAGGEGDRGRGTRTTWRSASRPSCACRARCSSAGRSRSGSARARGPAGCGWSSRAAATWTVHHRRRTKRCCSTRAPARCSSVSARSTRSTSRTTDLELWGLADRLTAPIDEDLSRGRRVCVVEAGGARLAILVCEDLARLHAVRRRSSLPWGVAAPGAGVRPAHQGPAVGARAGRGLQRRHRRERRGRQQPGDRRDPPHPRRRWGRRSPSRRVTPPSGTRSEPDDVVVFALDGDGPRVAYET